MWKCKTCGSTYVVGFYKVCIPLFDKNGKPEGINLKKYPNLRITLGFTCFDCYARSDKIQDIAEYVDYEKEG